MKTAILAVAIVASGGALAQSRRVGPPARERPQAVPSVPTNRAGLRPATITATTPNADGNFGGPGTGGGGGPP